MKQSENVFIYPGSFCPPTYGHLNLVKRAAEIFPEVTIICSNNSEKNSRWFSEEECKKLWQAYDLPENVFVETFASFNAKNIDREKIIIIRGIRGEEDLDDEKRVMLLNRNKFNIDKYFYLFSKCAYQRISSSTVRTMAENFDFQGLAKSVAPMVVTKLLEKVLGAKNVFMAVGRTGAGKTTFLKKLAELDKRNHYISADEVAAILRPEILKAFGANVDLFDLALNREEELNAMLLQPWLDVIKEKLSAAKGSEDIFIEVPFALQPTKNLFRFLGGKIIYFGCDESKNRERVLKRGNSKHLDFITRIPDARESQAIAIKYRLKMELIDTNGDLDNLLALAGEFNLKLYK